MEKRNQHYVPQFYLNFFTDPLTPYLQKPYIWVMDRKNMSIKNRAPKNIGYQKGFYDIFDANGKRSTIVEEQFQQIEYKAAKILKKIMKRGLISEKEQLDLCKFIFSMRQRVPYFKRVYKEAIETGELRDLFKSHKIEYDNDATSELKMDSVIRVANLASSFLMNMYWSLLIAPEKENFITSDNPVVVIDSKGYNYQFNGYIKSENIKLTFPINPKMCLYASWQLDKELIEHISVEEVNEINFDTFKYSDRFLYSSSKYFDKKILLVSSLVNEGLIK